jgi:hypothetical protein
VGIYTSPHPHCSSSHYISFISYSYTLLLIYLLSLNGLLCIVLFILDIYIVNQVGSPQNDELVLKEPQDFSADLAIMWNLFGIAVESTLLISLDQMAG